MCAGYICDYMQLFVSNGRIFFDIVEPSEVGPKIGDNGTETGFLRLRNVRIPRYVPITLSEFWYVTRI